MFTIQHYITKFEAIPEPMWGTGRFQLDDGRCCALGFCSTFIDEHNYKLHSERSTLSALFREYLDLNVIFVNDGGYDEYTQSTPKQRILAACYAILALVEQQKKDGSILS